MKKWKIGIGMIAVLLVVAVSGCTSDTNSTTTTAPTPEQTPTTVTIAQLYDGSIAQGTYVKVTGKCIQTSGSELMMANTDGKDIMVKGDSLNAYEDKSVTVVGTFVGPTSYETVMGAARTVPTIENAKIA